MLQAQGTPRRPVRHFNAALNDRLLICRTIVMSKFGKVLIAIRDANRARAFSISGRVYKLCVFILSACMAGSRARSTCRGRKSSISERILAGQSIEACVWSLSADAAP